LRGELDPLVTPADLEQLAIHESVHARTLAQAGHLLPCEQPHAVASAIESWLASARIHP
jgi:pimeloyl-ACP methyl ester carboxylesterase